jgi:hypothetical protein
MFKEFLMAKYNMVITKRVMTRPTPKIVMTPGTSLPGNRALSIRGMNQIARKLKNENNPKLVIFFEMIFCIIVSKNFCAKRASEGGAGIPFPLTPFPSSAARAGSLERFAKLRQQFCSKWVRVTFRISHQQELCKFFSVDKLIASRLRRSAGARPASRNAAKSHGSPNETETFIHV